MVLVIFRLNVLNMVNFSIDLLYFPLQCFKYLNTIQTSCSLSGGKNMTHDDNKQKPERWITSFYMNFVIIFLIVITIISIHKYLTGRSMNHMNANFSHYLSCNV